jgi:hypothetical protein
MSIINDALKKAQAKMENKDTKEPKEEPKDIAKVYERLQQAAQEKRDASSSASTTKYPGTPSSKPTAKTAAKGKEKTSKGVNPALIIIFILLLTGFVVYKYVLKGTVPSFVKKSDTWTPNYNPPPPPKKNYAPDEFVFSGTMMTGDTRVALINDDVYSIGDTIQGRTITNITKDTVDLIDAAGVKSTIKIGKN